MKSLTLLRHAEAASIAGTDFDRPLTPAGRIAARDVGRHLRDAGVRFDHVVASPALRVEQTIEGVAHGLGHGLDPVRDRRLYLASAATLIDAIRETPDGFDRLLLVGHNMGLEELAVMLAPDQSDPAMQRLLAGHYPTAGLADFTLDVADWTGVAAGTGRLTAFFHP